MSQNLDLDQFTALDPDGQAVELGTFWRQQPVVLAFVRHFG